MQKGKPGSLSFRTFVLFTTLVILLGKSCSRSPLLYRGIVWLVERARNHMMCSEYFLLVSRTVGGHLDHLPSPKPIVRSTGFPPTQRQLPNTNVVDTSVHDCFGAPHIGLQRRTHSLSPGDHLSRARLRPGTDSTAVSMCERFHVDSVVTCLCFVGLGDAMRYAKRRLHLSIQDAGLVAPHRARAEVAT
jgi:hypothetical protein